MFIKYNRTLYILKLWLLSFTAILCISCVASVKAADPSIDGRLSAENSMMKKRLPLIERENDVLKKENLQHRTKIQELENRIQELDSGLKSLNEKYTKDMAAEAEQISNLKETLQMQEKDSNAKIEALVDRNKALEDKQVKEVQVLKEQIAVQKEAFGRQREQIIQENAARESKLTIQLNDLQKTVEAKGMEVSSLKLAISEISLQLGEAKLQSEVLKKARDESLAELESQKSANADLIKKVTVLTNEASVQDHRPQPGR
jgi:chromosome segregation ATPase